LSEAYSGGSVSNPSTTDGKIKGYGRFATAPLGIGNRVDLRPGLSLSNYGVTEFVKVSKLSLAKISLA